MSARLKVPIDCRDAARLAARWHGTIHRAAELRPSTLLDLLTAVDALRRPERLDTLLAACEADAMSRPGMARGAYAPAAIVRAALSTVRDVRVTAVARAAERKKGSGDAIAAAIRAARLSALREWRRQQKMRSG
jgi:tRNA nucleotidyltransferase (CCA-adding enzyme)